MNGRLRNPPLYAALFGTSRTVTGAFTVLPSDNNGIIALNVASGGVAGTVTAGLPVGFKVLVTDSAGTLSGSNIATITMASGETVNGQATATLEAANATVWLTKTTSTTWSAK